MRPASFDTQNPITLNGKMLDGRVSFKWEQSPDDQLWYTNVYIDGNKTAAMPFNFNGSKIDAKTVVANHDTPNNPSTAYANAGILVSSSADNLPCIALLRQGKVGAALSISESGGLILLTSSGQTFRILMEQMS